MSRFIRSCTMLSLAALLISLVSVAHPAQAVSTILYVDADATGANNGTSWANAYIYLQDALGAASTGNEIWVAEGVYYPDELTLPAVISREWSFELKNGVEIYGGFDGSETKREQRDPAAHITVLSGDLDKNDTTDANDIVTNPAQISGNNAYHVTTGSGTNQSAVLDGFTITAGLANGTGTSQNGGAGMINDAGSPTLTNLVFIGNKSTGWGSGMINFSGSSPTLRNVTFINNSSDAAGGGMSNSSSNPSLTNVVFLGNSAISGGGIYNVSSSPMLTNVYFLGNTADKGGGLYNISSSDPVLTNSVFSGNAATTSGGGMISYTYSSPVLTNVSFSLNTAGTSGGGAANFSSSSPIITNSIFRSNTAATGAEMLNTNSAALVGYTLINAGGVANVSGGSWTEGGTGNITTGLNPLFVDADGADNIAGTLDDNLRLQAGSPALDAGNNGLVPADVSDIDGDGNTAEALPVDLDNSVRVQNGTVDMGAYERGTSDFVDVPSAQQPLVFQDWIQMFYDAGITTGCGNNPLRYCPERNVTRGEMAVFILRAMEYPNLPYDPLGDPTDPFVDVFSGSTALPAPFMEDWIEEFYTRNITGGKGTCTETASSPDLTYCPKDLVTRGEMAVFILRALGVTPVDDSSDPFADVPGNLPAPFMEPWVETFLAEGITTGKAQCNDGTLPGPGEQLYCPQDNVTRAEMAVFILRAFDSIPDPNDP